MPRQPSRIAPRSSSYSESDPELSPGFAGFDEPTPVLDDLAPDRPANATNTFTYTLRLCRLAREHLQPR